jgi:hypothetical protein
MGYMTSRQYYLMTLGAWQRHAPDCVESHFVLLDRDDAEAVVDASPQATAQGATAAHPATFVLALITASEAAHIALENGAEAEALPHPLARTAVSDRVATALASFGVAQGDDTFTVAEKVGRVNALLRYRVF